MKTHPTKPYLRAVALAAFAAPLLACQTTSRTSAEAEAKSPPTAMQDGADMGQAMIQPLTDLNITRAEIPAPLKSAAAAPYHQVTDESCSAIGAEVLRLDAALGDDLDAVEEGEDESVASKLAAGALRSLTTGWIPFRGILRNITGAEAHAKAVREAVLAGAVRRAYLKGVGERQGCPTPAAPRRAAAPAAPGEPTPDS